MSVIAILQPLLAMARQAEAWVEFTDAFKNAAQQQVSTLLSPKSDPFHFFKRFEKMQRIFTWKVTGMQMLYSVIAGTITGYFAVMWMTSCAFGYDIVELVWHKQKNCVVSKGYRTNSKE